MGAPLVYVQEIVREGRWGGKFGRAPSRQCSLAYGHRGLVRMRPVIVRLAGFILMLVRMPGGGCASGTDSPVRRSRLHVTGASGSGTTTLVQALADTWAVPHADADDYFWLPTDPPYVDKRSEVNRLALMEQVFLPREAWVLSGSMLGWGDSVVGRCDAVVFLTLDPAERMRRIEAREHVRRGGVRWINQH